MNNEAINVAIPKICQTCEHHRPYEGTSFDAPSVVAMKDTPVNRFDRR